MLILAMGTRVMESPDLSLGAAGPAMARNKVSDASCEEVGGWRRRRPRHPAAFAPAGSETVRLWSA
eukprot:3419271-Rhodomonas_salina.1